MNRVGGARLLAVPPEFSLGQTCAPVAWGRGRWPNADWIDGALTWVGWERGEVVWRRVRLPKSGTLAIDGPGDPAADDDWVARVLGTRQEPPAFADPLVAALAVRYAGLRPWAADSLVEGLIDAIVGQSISVLAAATTEARLAARFHQGIDLDGRRFWPFPMVDQLAASDAAIIRSAGLTWRRAEAIVAVAQGAIEGRLPPDEAARADPDAARAALRTLPLVGPWTAESALLWGLGLPDAHPSGDVALLRAARRCYGRPELDLKGLDRLAEAWRPARGWAARLLWTDLLGVAGVGG